MALSTTLKSWLDRTVIVQNDQSTGQDIYGNDVPVWTDVATVRGRMERARNIADAELIDPGLRDTGVLLWWVYLDMVDEDGETYTLDRSMRLTIDGRVFSLHMVEDLTNPRGDPHHYEVLASEVS